MMTKEEVAQVLSYREENKVSNKRRLEDMGVFAGMFYDARCKYAIGKEVVK